MKCSHVCHQKLFHLLYIFQLTLLLLSPASNFIPGRAISPKDKDSVYGHRDFYQTLVNLEGKDFLGKIIPFLIFPHIQGQFCEVKDKGQNLASARATESTYCLIFQAFHKVPRPACVSDGCGAEQNKDSLSRNQENVTTMLKSRVARDATEPAATSVKLIAEADCYNLEEISAETT